MTLIHVRRQHDDHRVATYKATDISGLHWSSTSGGVGKRMSRDFLCGYVLCDGMVEGDLAHSCSHGPPPHRVKVVVLKSDNDKRIYDQLSKRLRAAIILSGHPFAVDLGANAPNDEAVRTWLEEHCASSFVRVAPGWGPESAKRGQPRGQQIWFAQCVAAQKFAAVFGGYMGHMNQAKQEAAAAFVLAAP